MLRLSTIQHALAAEEKIFLPANGGVDAITGIKSLFKAGATELSWVKPGFNLPAEKWNEVRAGVLICNGDTYQTAPASQKENTVFLITPHPERLFREVLLLWETAVQNSAGVPETIHPTAIINPGAKLGEGVKIGPYALIGACELGNGVTIGAYTQIFDGVVIGADTLVREHCSIGGAGFGFTLDEAGNNVHIPHIGGVRIGKGVHIFPFANIDRATLDDTVVEDYAIIDHYCHIGHNTAVGTNSIITAGVVLAGGSSIGERCFVGVNTVVKQKVKVGNEVTTGMGAVVTKNIPPGEVWVGNPAQPLAEVKAQNDFLKSKLPPENK